MRTFGTLEQSGRRPRIVGLVWLLCGLAVALAVSALVLQTLEARPVGVPVLVQDGLLVALEMFCVPMGALISVHRPGNRVGGLLAGALALSAFSPRIGVHAGGRILQAASSGRLCCGQGLGKVAR